MVLRLPKCDDRIMSYSAIDPIINVWKHRHSLAVGTEFKDTQVRTTEVVSRTGEMFQIWIDEPNEVGKVGVHVWDHKDRKYDWEVSVDRLDNALDEAVQTAKSWMKSLH